MPSNHILINNSMEFIVVDSKMENLLEFLKHNGRVVDTGIKKEPDEPILVTSDSLSQS